MSLNGFSSRERTCTAVEDDPGRRKWASQGKCASIPMQREKRRRHTREPVERHGVKVASDMREVGAPQQHR